MTPRRTWLWLHLWMGVVLGAWFVLLGLTGSLLVFYPQIDRWLDPAHQVTGPCTPAPSGEAVYAALRASEPARTGPWRIELPRARGMAYDARYNRPAERADRAFAPLMVTVDACTLQVTSRRFWGDYPMTWLYDLHYQLLLGARGEVLVGIAGLLLLFSLGSGVYLWWPRGSWRAALRPQWRRGIQRATYDWHTRTGVYGLVLLVVLTGTGVLLALPDYANPVIHRLSPLQPMQQAVSRWQEDQPRLPLDAALRIAEGALPQAQARWIETPSGSGGSYRVRLWQPGEPSERFPLSYVWVDPSDGRVLAIQDARARHAGNALLAWLHPLHNGEAFGLVGQWLAVAAGLLPLVLFVTGLMRWRHKARRR